VALERHAEDRRARDGGDAERAAGELFLVAHDQEHEDIEAKRREREVVVLYAQRRKAERQPDREARHRRDRQHGEERHAELEQDCRVIRADPEERRLSERHLAGVADSEVKPEGRHQVHAAERQQVDVAALQERGHDRERHQGHGKGDRPQADSHTLRSSALPSRPSGRSRITPRNRSSATPSL
jgi:hypothetical protein